MNGKIDTSAGTRLYLDSNAFIEAFEKRGPLNDKLVNLLAIADEQAVPRFVTSELTLAELLVKPIERQQHDLIGVYENLTVTNSFLEVVPVAREYLAGAALLRAQNRAIKLPDAIHLATAVRTDCRYFLTGDNGIRAGSSIEILRLNEANIDVLIKGLRGESD